MCCVICTLPALEKQQEGLLETRDRIVDWKVKEKEQELQQDFRYQVGL